MNPPKQSTISCNSGRLLPINRNGISYQVYTYVDWPKQLTVTHLPKEVPSTSGIIGGHTGCK
jgi:hypothetical protein